MTKPSMRQVARAAGVSVATVSTLLSGKRSNIRVSEQTRQRVLTACHRVGYEPNIHAQRLSSKRSMALGMVFPPLEEHLRIKHSPDLNLAAIMQGAASSASRFGYQIVLNPADTEFFRKKQYLRLVRSLAVDGLIIWGIGLDHLYVDELAQEKVPFVMVQSIVGHATEAGYPYVISDSQKASRQIAEHFINLGHRKIGYIRGFQTSSVGTELWIGFRETMIKHELYNDSLICDGDYTIESGWKGAQYITQKCPDVTAIACANELMAAGAIEYISQQGLSVPDDISVSGHGAVHSILIKPLTTCSDPVYDMGGIAAEKLIDFINEPASKNESPHFQVVLEPEIRIGSTTGSPPQR